MLMSAQIFLIADLLCFYLAGGPGFSRNEIIYSFSYLPANSLDLKYSFSMNNTNHYIQSCYPYLHACILSP